MAQIVKLRRSSVIGKKPTNAQLELGELSINTADGKVYFAKSGSLGPSIEELVSTNTVNTGSIFLTGDITGSIFTGSFKGDGSNLYNVPASGVTGLQLNRISSGSYTASISEQGGFQVNTDISITGSLNVSGGYISGDGQGLYNVPASGVTGLQLNRISDGSVTASISQTNGFSISTNSAITGSLSVSGNLILSGSLTDATGSTGTSNQLLTTDGDHVYWTTFDPIVVSGDTKKLIVSSPSTTWNFNHNLNSLYPAITVFNSDGYVIIPQNIHVIDYNNLTVSFASSQTGVVSATIGGNGSSGTAGTSGSSGISGVNGSSGTSGSSGSSGTAGTSGSSGTSGTSGTDGTGGLVQYFASATTWSVSHNLGTNYPLVNIWDSNNHIVIPQQITTIDGNTIEVIFSSPVQGYVNVAKGGHFVSGSVNYTNVGSDIIPALNNTYDLGSLDFQWKDIYVSTGSIYVGGVKAIGVNENNQIVIGTQVFNTTGTTGNTTTTITGELKLEDQLTLINTGSNVQSYIGVASQVVSGSATLIDLGSFDGANFDYIVKNGSNMKCGNIASIWNGSISSHNELNTTDLGDTSPVSFDVTNNGLLNVNVSSGTWKVEVHYRALGNII
jgi:hypothetical protein